MKIVEVNHPLVKHKLGLMRADISTKHFRELATEVGSLLTYEATADLEIEKVIIDGWCDRWRSITSKEKSHGCADFTCGSWHDGRCFGTYSKRASAWLGCIVTKKPWSRYLISKN